MSGQEINSGESMELLDHAARSMLTKAQIVSKLHLQANFISKIQ